MIVDSSALIAIFFREPDHEIYTACLSARPNARIKIRLQEFLDRGLITVMSFFADHGGVARDAFRRYGRGRHPAALSFGDCMAYAVARLANEPLLYKGNDFSQTDIASALDV